MGAQQTPHGLDPENLVWKEEEFPFQPCFVLDVSENGGTPKSSILIGFSIIFTTILGKSTIFVETPFWCP